MAAPAEAKSLIKREPVLLASGAMTVLSTIVYVLPSMGIKIPDKVQKGFSLLAMVAGGLGVRSLVKPA
jgi:hypothetical protein